MPPSTRLRIDCRCNDTGKGECGLSILAEAIQLAVGRVKNLGWSTEVLSDQTRRAEMGDRKAALACIAACVYFLEQPERVIPAPLAGYFARCFREIVMGPDPKTADPDQWDLEDVERIAYRLAPDPSDEDVAAALNRPA